ncbi:phosphate ABC transporter substrate-binding protein [Mycoplasma putrefaciens]|uniref:Phosphate ABC transporter, substrate-binding component n=1 Tax=Mycoplasma putrefaciens Mput9231 TaxID=1292033 RepID=M9WCQ1_9MOLU|nr:phosphate ABC transporter substrate-binding protein [Mycoplasma putrefaciens]AGJ90907.1 Phosphate ABC transporter, substrate-binding component [Mycoplasma putrefaciens Mput9231]
MKKDQTVVNQKTSQWFSNFIDIAKNKRLILVFIIIIASILGLWTWTFLTSNNTISIGGSASADPIMQRLTNIYQKKTKKAFVYSSTGSGAGASNVVNNTYNIGFISKSETDQSIPKQITDHLIRKDQKGDGELFKNITSENKDQTFNQLLNERQTQDQTSYHFVDFAKDSIVFIYNINGTGLTNDQIQNIEFMVADNKINEQATQALQAIYAVNDQSKLISWREFYKKLTGKDEANINNKTKVTAYSTNSGSGTKSSFEIISGFKAKNYKVGQAVNQYNSNGAIFEQISRSKGAFGFVSMQYAREIKKFPNLKAVIIKKDDKKWDINKTIDYQDYPLNRPFVALYKMTGKKALDLEILEFIYWVSSSNEPEVKSLYEKLGLVQNWQSQNYINNKLSFNKY